MKIARTSESVILVVVSLQAISLTPTPVLSFEKHVLYGTIETAVNGLKDQELNLQSVRNIMRKAVHFFIQTQCSVPMVALQAKERTSESDSEFNNQSKTMTKTPTATVTSMTESKTMTEKTVDNSPQYLGHDILTNYEEEVMQICKCQKSLRDLINPRRNDWNPETDSDEIGFEIQSDEEDLYLNIPCTDCKGRMVVLNIQPRKEIPRLRPTKRNIFEAMQNLEEPQNKRIRGETD